MRWYHCPMAPRGRRRGALAALAILLGGAVLAPSTAVAQTPAQTPAQRVVVLLPFEGSATQDLVADAEATVRGALLARGARLPDRAAINLGLGLSPPTDTAALARAAQGMGATQVIRATLRPLTGQYNLSLTLVDAASGRTATREESIPAEGSGEVVGRMLDALLDPANWSAPPVDPALAREAEARRLAEEEAARQRQATEAEAARRRAEEEARRLREAEERAHPVRGYADGGPFSAGLSLVAGGRLSGVRQPSGTVLSGNAPAEASSAAVALRAEGSYAIGAVPGLEAAAAFMILTTPTTAVGLGRGAGCGGGGGVIDPAPAPHGGGPRGGGAVHLPLVGEAAAARNRGAARGALAGGVGGEGHDALAQPLRARRVGLLADGAGLRGALARRGAGRQRRAHGARGDGGRALPLRGRDRALSGGESGSGSARGGGARGMPPPRAAARLVKRAPNLRPWGAPAPSRSTPAPWEEVSRAVAGGLLLRGGDGAAVGGGGRSFLGGLSSGMLTAATIDPRVYLRMI